MYKVTYCVNLEKHKYAFKVFETKELALEWCFNNIGGLHRYEYEELITEIK